MDAGGGLRESSGPSQRKGLLTYSLTPRRVSTGLRDWDGDAGRHGNVRGWELFSLTPG
jgi:hypothetical protein